MRVLLSILAVMSFILGITLDRPLLFWIAGVLLLVILGSLIWMWRRRQHEERDRERDRRKNTDQDRELHDLGIMEIRPREASKQTVPEEASISTAEAPEAPPAEPPPREDALEPPAEEPPTPEAAVETPRQAADDADATRQDVFHEPDDTTAPNSEEAHSEESQPDDEETERSVTKQPASGETLPNAEEAHERADALTPLLQSLRAAVEARTVALLKQEDIALEYEITALVSNGTSEARDAGDTFTTSTALLTAGMTQRDITVQRVGEMALPLESLGYYEEPTDVRQVMIAPVKRPSEPASYFLLADTAQEGGFNAAPPRALIVRFADLMATLLRRSEAVPVESSPDARPRSEIINEEIDAAHEGDRPLALALVYLNRAEALADEGEQSVSSADHTLRKRLEKAASEGRVERFGELTYGVFYPAHGDEAEAWAMQLQSDLDKERGRLEGGVSVGVAVLSDHHESPDALRADATEALREAYTTGTCTIIE